MVPSIKYIQYEKHIKKVKTATKCAGTVLWHKLITHYPEQI